MSLIERMAAARTQDASDADRNRRLLEILHERRLRATEEPGTPGDGAQRDPALEEAKAKLVAASRRSGGPGLMATKNAIHKLLVDRHADEIDVTNRDGVREKIVALVDEYFKRTESSLTRLDYQRLVDSLLDDVLGLGPLEPLLKDPSVTEIMINHPKQVFIERAGQVALSSVTFETDRQLKQIIDRIVSTIGRRVDESSPMCDARLKDGSRVNVVVPPLTLKGACMTIRKFAHQKLDAADMVGLKTASPEMIRFLQAAVSTKLNILVSGGTSSGKTTLLNVLSSFIPADERIITIEDAAELKLQQEHVITMEARPANVEGRGSIEIRDLVRNSLRMRPDRIVVGECRGGEALDMLQAMNTGHEGSMSTVHANSPYDALSRLETMVLMAGTDLPSRAIQKQIASAIDIIVQAQRLRGGARRIVSIAEITGLANGEPQYHELFTYRQVGVGADGAALGYHTATGVQSVHLDHFARSGAAVPAALFSPVEEPAADGLY